MTKKYRHPVTILSGFFLLLLDQTLKSLVRARPEFSFAIIPRWLGWEYLANPGVAVGQPIPNNVVVVLTPAVILLLVIFLSRNHHRPYHFLAVILILAGAVSNYLDRIFFGVAIDYFRVATSIINLADILIVSGAGLLLLKKEPSQEPV
ncbi:MAG: signal peptidase II [Candidatus Magasanikbacteria bacterium]|nr:signal peptidase II [Candidatus Magasanikbacteria bacterium]